MKSAMMVMAALLLSAGVFALSAAGRLDARRRQAAGYSGLASAR